MADAPDPNRRMPAADTDRELGGSDEAQEGGTGNIGTSRVWFPSWLSVTVMVIAVVVVLFLLRSRH
ncbi:MAG: hypothetical protein JWM27_4228 [Gemmatimonadetes bacterium]|nr:hypothetical protein [Gemmatimonadota bacterium]